MAAINGRDFVTPDDIKKVASAVLCHRIMLHSGTRNGRLTPIKVVQQIIETIEIPR